MVKITALFLCLFLIYTVAESKITCRTCETVTEECELSNTVSLSCGKNGVCHTAYKQGSSKEKAFRKCAVPDFKTGKVSCPPNYECEQCDTDECNTASQIFNRLNLTFIGVITAFTYLFPKYIL